jgi:hypothetical protein
MRELDRTLFVQMFRLDLENMGLRAQKRTGVGIIGDAVLDLG